ncbi:MAG: DUF1097 family protein [Campylobacteraceae bacterium]|nr:DUF1097 family protein [Campylobacteraceae bacterium]
MQIKHVIKNIIVYAIFGILCACLTALSILTIPLAAHISFLSTIFATVFGYASTFTYILQTKNQLSIEALTTFNSSNTIVIISLSIILGTLFGFSSGKLGSFLGNKEYYKYILHFEGYYLFTLFA